MKKGKTSQLTGYENAKCSYGTVDAKKLKSVYKLRLINYLLKGELFIIKIKTYF